MKYLSIGLLAITMTLGGMTSDTFAKHGKVGDTWIVTKTHHGLVWKKFDKKKHVKKYKHMKRKHHKKHMMKHKHHNHKHHKMKKMH